MGFWGSGVFPGVGSFQRFTIVIFKVSRSGFKA